MLDFLPPETQKKLLSDKRGALTEVRIRKDRPIVAVYYNGGKKTAIFPDLILNGEQIEESLLKLCDYSFFSREESVKNAFVTSREGERVGICGEAAVKNGEVVAFKNFTSLTVRIPNDIKGCALKFFSEYVKKPCSVFVISPPYQGKTTFIRDLGRLYSDRLGMNALFIDERDEFSAGGKFYLGANSDVFRYCDKEYAVKCGIRAINPSVIVCDEIMNEKDSAAMERAAECGVKIIASAHSDSLNNILKKQEIKAILNSFMFDVIVVLKDFGISAVYDGELKKLC